ncbi:MAG TPA: NADH-quinone oxidoreductase subunit G [Mycobacteriales bacterium]|nr:NADH-quinone oxidoreductase subunit G [Mycobacteriales bacterium]
MTSTQDVAVQTDLCTVTIDGFEVQVPKGTLVIRAAELVGIQVPRFCDHPALEPVGACRQCIVEVEGQRKPVASCTTTVADGMVVRTHLTSPVAEKAQKGTLELLLINHPLDCPVCDKGGECPLQNQAMSHGGSHSRFHDVKRTFPKPVAISSQVLLDRERCVLCARCTRFSEQVAGDPFIELFERGALQQVAVYADQPFESYFSGNTVQICPVGALTGAAYRFRARPFDLVSTPMVCEHCASGCALRTDHRRGKVTRRMAGDDPQVNDEWNCDKGRWAFAYATQPDRITTPLVRDDSGALRPASWTEALDRAARGLALARDEGGVGLLPGGRLTVEDAYAWSKFARVALGTNDIDARVRPGSDEELAFLASAVAGRYLETTYSDLEAAPVVLLAGLEPEEESPIVFLRLRKAVRREHQQVITVASHLSRGAGKLSARLVQALPGQEAQALRGLAGDEELRAPGAVVLVGERLASAPGALAAAAELARATGAKLAWVPRRAGERGAVDAGALPTLLPGGRRVTDESARTAVATSWGDVPAEPGRDLVAILEAVKSKQLKALLVGAVDPADTPDAALALDALEAAEFVVSLELRRSAVTDRADVVLPVPAAVEKAGTYIDWEGRARPFDAVLQQPGVLPDHRVLHLLADELDRPIGLGDVAAVRAEISALGAVPQEGDIPASADETPALQEGEALLSTWHLLLDDGSLQDGEPHLAGTARRPVALLSRGTAAGLGAADGDVVTVSTDRGSISLPLLVADLPDGVVWVPTRSREAHVRTDLVAAHGSVVRLAKGGAQ